MPIYECNSGVVEAGCRAGSQRFATAGNILERRARSINVRVRSPGARSPTNPQPFTIHHSLISATSPAGFEACENANGFIRGRKGSKRPAMIYIEIATVAVLIVINGLLAMSELSIVSSRPARLKAMIDRNVRGAKRALELSSNPGRFLSTVQIGITLVGVFSGAFSRRDARPQAGRLPDRQRGSLPHGQRLLASASWSQSSPTLR